MFRSLSTPLDLAKFRAQGIHVGVRKMLTILDTTPQSLALSATLLLSFDSSKSGAGAFGSKGADISLGADDALVIEELGAGVVAQDASGKLKLNSLSIAMGNSTNGAILFPLVAVQVLPYTYAPVQFDFWYGVLNSDRFVFYHNENLTFPLSANVQAALTNTDAAGAHTYLRALTMAYRIVSGLDVSTPLVLPEDA